MNGPIIDAGSRVDILLPVWGRSYIQGCLSHCLRSLLAPGNLPAMAALMPVRLTLLTRQDDIALFEASPLWPLLMRLADIHYVPIDDLIVDGAYGVVLTLALRRGMTTRGADMTATHFVLLMSDFVFADGSFARLATEVLANRAAIFAPSWRVIAERVAPRLDQMTEADALTIRPRDAADMALANLHPTVVARMADQQVFGTRHPNQLYWRDGDAALLSRQMLMHLFCLRPERALGPVTSFFDYGLTEEATSSGDLAFLLDSDQFLALEMQALKSESDNLQWGGVTTADIVSDATSWTTPIHRRLFLETCILRGQGASPLTDDLLSQIQRQSAAIAERLPPPLPVANHPFWLSGLADWASMLGKQAPADVVLAPAPVAPTSILSQSKQWLVRRILGHGSRVTPLHPRWAELRTLRRLRPLNAETVLVSANPGDFKLLLAGNCRSMAPNALSEGEVSLAAASCLVADVGVDRLDPVLSTAASSPPMTEIVVVLRTGIEADISLIAPRLLKTLTEWKFNCYQVDVGGNPVGAAATFMARAFSHDLWHGGIRRLLILAFATSVVVTLSLLSALIEVFLVERNILRRGNSVVVLRCRKTAGS